jgi:hypothetical protein
MIPNKAIEKAVEGGWEPSDNPIEDWAVAEKMIGREMLEARTICDLSFWQALGKVMGWPEKYEWAEADSKNTGDEIEKEELAWKYNAHRFYELILTECDAKAYWDELLVPNVEGRV